MKKLMSLFLFTTWLSLILTSSAQAILHLELTKGAHRTIPIAIYPFEKTTDESLITPIIIADLSHSGRFKVTQAQAGPHHVKEVNQASWQQQHINAVLVGSITALNANRFSVSVQLLNIYSKEILLNKQFTVARHELRSLAHHISDLVYQKLIGKRGIFSTHIAYVLIQHPFDKNRLYQLIYSDVDGYNPRVLLSSPMPIMSPAFSPKGEKIAYVSFEGGHAGIYVQTLATGQRRKVSSHSGVNGAPAWSPEGDKLALVLTKTGYPKIYMLNLSTNQLKPITQGYSIDTEPTFTPDGQSLLFTSNRGGSPQIYQTHLNGSEPSRVTFSGAYNAKAALTNNGNTLITLQGGQGFNIAKQDLQTGHLTLLTHHGKAQSPSVAPNGDMVLYTLNDSGKQRLSMVSIDGKIQLNLPSQAGSVREPAWSPF